MAKDKKLDEEIASLMSGTMRIAQAVKRRETQGPLPVMHGTLPNRMELVLQHRAEAARARDSENVIQRVSSSMLAPVTHGVAPQGLSGLEPIVLSEAVQKVNMIQVGRVMFLTIVEEAFRTVATSMIVKDTQGNIMTLHLYNYVPAEVLPRVMLPVGSRIAFVHPYLRFPRDNEANPVCMRCDNPQAVHLLSERRYEQCTVHSDFEWTEEQEVIQVSAAAAAELSEQGNLAFSSGHFLEAISFYNKALRTAPPEDPARARFLCNRAQCHVRKGRWSAALADSEGVLGLDPTYKKSAYCRALALLMLQRPVEARDAAADPLLDSLATSGKADAATKVSTLRADIEHAVLEQESGDYDLQALLKESESGVSDASPGCVSQRHCDYESPHIKMVEGSRAKGQCMVAEKAIPAGTLLMAAKAFDFEQDNVHSIDTTLRGSHMNAGSSARILPRVVQAILDRPESSSELYTLSAGSAFDGKPLPGYTGAVDVIRGILCNNWFSGTKVGCGDCCLPNSTYFNVGDFMFISTARDVEAGEELTLPYLDPMMPFEERTQILAGWNSGNGFECDCARCDACRRHPELASLESETSTMLKRVAQLSATMPVGTAIGIVKAQCPSTCMGALERFSEREACGVLLRMLELDAGALAHSGKPDQAIPIYQRSLDIRTSAFGTFGTSNAYVCDSLRLFVAGIWFGKQSVARQSMLAAFKVACVPGWHGLPLSLPDVHLLMTGDCSALGDDDEHTMSMYTRCHHLLVEANGATGNRAILKSPHFCAYCIEGAPKMFRCQGCRELYCSREHQKAHWKIHKKECK
eukprot:gene11462-34176_t